VTGWKTKAAGLLAILYGLLGWALDVHGADEAMRFVVDGIGILGIGHKIEKAGALTVSAPPSRNAEEMTDEEFAAYVRRQLQ
jgi:hypothetical protein